MKAATYSIQGKKATTETSLPKSVFGEKEGSVDTIKQVLQAYQANGRTINSNTKTRGLVRGGGRKPWKQKGTGRARVGSIRSPLWKGGGITFGPLANRNFSKRVNAKMRKAAVRQSLSMKAKDKQIVVVKDLAKLGAKTSELAKLLQAVGAGRKTVVLAENLTENINRSASNLSDVTAKQASYVNINDAVNSDLIVIEESAIPMIETVLKGAK